MTQNDRDEAYNKFMKAYGFNSQVMMWIEEMSELTKEFCKLLRYGKNNISEELRDNIVAELADVHNTIDQMEKEFGREEIERIRDEKIARGLKRLDEK